jgi:hypothetical protein
MCLRWTAAGMLEAEQPHDERDMLGATAGMTSWTN